MTTTASDATALAWAHGFGDGPARIVIQVECSPGMVQRIDEAAKSCGMGAADWLRRAAIRELFWRESARRR